MNETERLLRSVRYAYDGIRYALATQRNMQIHWFFAIFTLLLSLVLDVTGGDLLWLLLAIASVISAELLNTAVEKAVDLASTERHPLAKAAKDLAAGAVLIMVGMAIAVGIYVFFRPLGEWMVHLHKSVPVTPLSAAVVLILVWLVVTLLENVYMRNFPAWRPNLTSAMAFAVPPVLTLGANAPLPVVLFGFLVSFLLFVVMGGKHRAKLQSLTVGALVGNIMTLAALILIYFV